MPAIQPNRIRWPSDGMHSSNDLPYKTIVAYLHKPRVVIANVMKGEHFVLVTGSPCNPSHPSLTHPLTPTPTTLYLVKETPRSLPPHSLTRISCRWDDDNDTLMVNDPG